MQILDSYTACSIVEGFADFEPTEQETLEAWAYLIKTGQCWSLQGFYGRYAFQDSERNLTGMKSFLEWLGSEI